GETLTITYNVTVTDNLGASLTQPVTITITGSNDAPVLAADASGPHTTIQAVQTSGTLTFTDVDLTDHHTASTSVTSTSWPLGVTPPSGIDAVLAGALSATVADTGSGSGSVAFTFSAGPALNSLAPGQTLTIKYNVTVTDGSGVSSTQPVTITVIGTNDAPTLQPVTGPTYTDTAAIDHITRPSIRESTSPPAPSTTRCSTLPIICFISPHSLTMRLIRLILMLTETNRLAPSSLMSATAI